MNDLQAQLWVEHASDVIVARLRGKPSAALLRNCHERVLELVRASGCTRVLLETLDMDPPSADLALVMRELEEAPRPESLRRAILVPTSRLAYLSRLVFGGGNYRVFYNDLEAALDWLRAGCSETLRGGATLSTASARAEGSPASD